MTDDFTVESKHLKCFILMCPSALWFYIRINSESRCECIYCFVHIMVVNEAFIMQTLSLGCVVHHLFLNVFLNCCFQINLHSLSPGTG